MSYKNRNRNRPKSAVLRQAFNNLAEARRDSPEQFDPVSAAQLATLEGECFETVFDGASHRISRAGRYALWKASELRAERLQDRVEARALDWIPPQVFQEVEALS